MPMPRSKRFAAWIALLAVINATAMPLFAGPRVQPRPDYLGALCTMGGVREAPAQPAVPPGGAAANQQHCVFCVSGTWKPPLDAAFVAIAPAETGPVVPAGRDDVPRSVLAALQSLSPRAPPRLL